MINVQIWQGFYSILGGILLNSGMWDGSITGIKVNPNGVVEYSGEGGNSGYAVKNCVALIATEGNGESNFKPIKRGCVIF